LRMEHHDEADEDADGAPQQVGGPEAVGIDRGRAPL
jgi:hypothetical protein